MVESIIDYIKERLSYFGKAPLCNLNPSHGICIMGFYLPLCARCIGILIGVLAGTILFFKLFKNNTNLKNPFLFLLLQIPCVIDGVLQYFYAIESTNVRRIATGVLFGIGISLLIESLFLCKKRDSRSSCNFIRTGFDMQKLEFKREEDCRRL